MAVNTLAQSLGTVKPPVASLLSGDITQRGAKSRKELPGMLERSYEAEEASLKSKMASEQGQIQREAEALEGSARQLRKETERVRGLEQPYQEFEAPKYTAADYAKGAATRALTAVILGGVAKTSAMTQLKAIKAMQDAEKEGRTQDFEAARLTFDEAEKKRLDFNQRLKRDLDDFEKLLQTDTKAALVKAKLIGAETQDAMVKALIDKQRYGDAISLAKEQIKQSDQLAMKREEQAARLAETALKEAAKGTTAGLKPGAKDVQAFISLNILQKDLQGLIDDLKDPELAALVKNNRAGAFFEEEWGKTAAQLLQTEIPPKLRTFLTKIKDIRNNYFLEISGKAVTSGEAMRSYGTVPQPGDDPEVIKNKIDGMIGRVNGKITLYNQIFTLPKIDVKAGQSTGLTPGANYGISQESGTSPLSQEEQRRLNELREKARQR